jgi:DNA-binding CsgD family transcriptional regulator
MSLKINDHFSSRMGHESEGGERSQNGAAISVHSTLAGLSTTKIGFAIFDRNLRYIDLNQILSDFDGLSIQEHLGRTVPQALGKLAQQVEPRIRDVLETGKPVKNVKIVGLRPSMTAPGKWIGNFFPLASSCDTVEYVLKVVTVIENRLNGKNLIEQMELKSASTRGTEILSRTVVDALVGTQVCQPRVSVQQSFSTLSPRERQIFELLAQCNSNKEIAWQLAISVKTVESHRSRIMIKLNVPSLAHLIHYAIKNRIVQI